MLAECAPTGEESHLPAVVFQTLASVAAPDDAVNAVVVMPELMHQLLKQVVDGDRHASSKLLKGYFVLHRLFLHFCDQWPAIRTAADKAIEFFKTSEEQRTKTAFPWIAYVLQLLTISNAGWDELKHEFVSEGLARDVQFVLASFPNYRPIDPEAEIPKTTAPETKEPFADWALFEHDHGTDIPGTSAGEQLHRGVWRGRPQGWSCLAAGFKEVGSRSVFSVRVRKLPRDGVIRIGWTEAEVCGPTNGWFYLASGGCFGSTSRAATPTQHKGQPYGQRFREGDLLTACMDRGIVSFRLNDRSLGHAFALPSSVKLRPIVCLKRSAEVELLEMNADPSHFFATADDLRNMAWEARLCRRGKTIVMFQVFFLSLVRPDQQSSNPDWESLKQEYDRHLGFPAQQKSDALMSNFEEVHRIISLRGADGWPLFFQRMGLGKLSTLEIDRLLFKAYQRATLLNYKMGGRHDHA